MRIADLVPFLAAGSVHARVPGLRSSNENDLPLAHTAWRLRLSSWPPSGGCINTNPTLPRKGGFGSRRPGVKGCVIVCIAAERDRPTSTTGLPPTRVLGFPDTDILHIEPNPTGILQGLDSGQPMTAMTKKSKVISKKVRERNAHWGNP